VANRDAAVAQVRVDRQSPGDAVGHRPAGVHDSGRGRLRCGAVAARAGEALAQVVVYVLRAVTAAVGRLAHALVSTPRPLPDGIRETDQCLASNDDCRRDLGAE
jgi:hypothetical protein